jgi:hypothetical protein
MAIFDAGTWTLWKIKHKYHDSFEMWCWRRMEKIIWTARVRNEEVSHRIKEESNILHTIKRCKANWIGHILRGDCLLKDVIEIKLEVVRRQGIGRKQLIDDNKVKKTSKFKEEAPGCTLWRRGCGLVVRQTV